MQVTQDCALPQRGVQQYSNCWDVPPVYPLSCELLSFTEGGRGLDKSWEMKGSVTMSYFHQEHVLKLNVMTMTSTKTKTFRFVFFPVSSIVQLTHNSQRRFSLLP